MINQSNDQFNGPINKWYPRPNRKLLPIGAADTSIDEEGTSSTRTAINRNVQLRVPHRQIDLGKSDTHNKFIRDHHKNYLGWMGSMG